MAANAESTVTEMRRQSGVLQTERDLVNRPVRSTLFYFALPVLGEQTLNTLVGLVDVFLAGRIGANATSAVGLGAYVAWLASMLVMLVGTGATAIISRHWGAGESEEADRLAGNAMSLGAITGIGIAILMYVSAPFFARYSNLSDETYHIAVTYLRLDAIGHLFLSITLVGCACFRGAGDTRTPMYAFMLINATNIAFSWGLVYGIGPLPRLGVNGIVAGTVIAQFVGAGLIVLWLSRGRSGLKLTGKFLRLVSARVTRILRIGLPAAIDGAVIWTGHFLFLAIISRLAAPPLNEVILAAHVIAIRVEAFTYLPAFAYGTACASLIGQALGAANPQRAMKVGYEAILQIEIVGLLMALAYYLGAPLVFQWMSVDSLVHLAGVEPFRALAILQPCLVLSIVLVGGFRGAGDTRFPLFMSFVGSIVIRLSVGWFFGIHLGWGLMGAWMGMFGDMIWRASAAFVRFRHRKWLTIRV